MFDAVLYVSRTAIPAIALAEQLADIQFVSLARNSMLDLTGMLIATPGYFVQFLQGQRQALADVMQSIRSDTRHTEVNEVPLAHFDDLLFPHWRMQCFGPGSFTNRHVQPTLERFHGSLADHNAGALIDAMRRIVAT